jgi:type II secretory pathway pseudopilin PulG
MSEAQYITFILGFAATIAAILIALLINNARLNDAKEALRAENKAGDSAILAQMAMYQLDIISKVAEIDNRLTRLER